MTVTIKATVQWIRQDYGGHRCLPVAGLRPTMRFQRGVSAWLSGGRDVKVLRLQLDEATWSGTAELRLANPDFEAEEKTAKYLVVGELIELLDAYRVIGVGRITSIEDDV